ncbi:MAG: metal-dependent transcriptional regulator [Catonella sp.]|uniref:metal-dependent transcriptional regulator n=1 Tax=Catonella sp. TaxID=2382125 RepID=UPI003FA124A4
MEIHESAEDYLETILVLTEKIGNVRSVDISNEMGFKKSSVSVAMKNLRSTGHIVVDENGYIKLTPAGKEVADMIYERHKFFSTWLISLGVNKETALEDACRIEHVISKESFSAMKEFLNSKNV